MNEKTPAALVLAAGAGRRFGRPKALVELDGELLVDRAVRIAAGAGCAPVVVVLGADAGVVARASTAAAVVVVNEGWRDGMGSSLRCGLSALTDLGAPGAVVLLVDQPGVPVEVIHRLTRAWRAGATAVAAVYDVQPRNPVLLDARVWPEVMSVAVGDVGARAWLRAHPDEVTMAACDDLGSPTDIDTPADLARLLEET